MKQYDYRPRLSGIKELLDQSPRFVARVIDETESILDHCVELGMQVRAVSSKGRKYEYVVYLQYPSDHHLQLEIDFFKSRKPFSVYILYGQYREVLNVNVDDPTILRRYITVEEADVWHRCKHFGFIRASYDEVAWSYEVSDSNGEGRWTTSCGSGNLLDSGVFPKPIAGNIGDNWVDEEIG